MKSFEEDYKTCEDILLEMPTVEVGEWQAIRGEDIPQNRTKELLDQTFMWSIPTSIKELQELVSPNLPWAEDHFQERIGGEPINPPPSTEWWPFNTASYEGMVDETKKFSHTYPERFWPKNAGEHSFTDEDGVSHEGIPPHKRGIRYAYGDLGDVINLLEKSPLTRQAYLPIWFPEDTGAVHGERVPCTLGYYFILRENRLHMFYPIRSCDLLRYFRDDVYMAARLCQHMVETLVGRQNFLVEQLKDYSSRVDWRKVVPGDLTMHIVSLHIFENDVPIIEARRKG